MTTELAARYTPADVEPAILARWNDARAFHADPADTLEHGRKPYAVVIPPPNVTAALHMGHALNNTLQDILVRWRRMAGYNAMWMPGTDHAGIATQTVVEKRVLAQDGKRRTDFAREDFVAKIQAWKDEYEATITNQLKTMGCSCDWDRQAFTMDPPRAKAVREAFFRLFKDGLIYRGKRLVNWDPATQTALADDEVENQEIDGHFYYLRYPLVKTTASPASAYAESYITVATTRPETMLGDTAVAINPRDPRAAALRGMSVRLPIVNRIIPIIEDDYVVLPVEYGGDPLDTKAQFATGFLKVTPAHDTNDWDIGLRHHLPVINVLSPTAAISKDHGWPEEDFAQGDDELRNLLGMDRFEARKAIVEWFRREKLLAEVKPYRHSVGHSYRSHVPIEPYLSDQWYVATTKAIHGHRAGENVPGTEVAAESLVGFALRAMEPTQRGGEYGARSREVMKTDEVQRNRPWEGRLRFIPERYARNFQTWHENPRDWCISRQLWWGHRIPVWAADLPRPADIEPKPTDRGPDAQVYAALDTAVGGKFSAVFSQKFPAAQYHLTVPDQQGSPDHVRVYICLRHEHQACEAWLKSCGFVQDPDVLDTWFSSALWPLSTLGWPDDTAELAAWNPSATLSTAREIITLWVSRMVMFNIYFRDCLPFRDVFIHAMIQDGEGRKMSKSLGNGVDPLDIIHSHGSDGMRYTLAQMTTQTQDVRLPVLRDAATGRNTSDRFDLGRNFANKIWNAVRFALSYLNEDPGDTTGADTELALADRWILSRLARTVHDTDASLESFEFSGYAQGLYDFIWRDLCDWYIEIVKPTLRQSMVQRGVLAVCLDVSLRLLHPVMPFLTEALWEPLNWAAPDRGAGVLGKGVPGIQIPVSKLLIRSVWPIVPATLIDPEAEGEFALAQQVITAVRQVRTQYKVPPRQQIEVSAKVPPALAQKAIMRGLLMETLCNLTVRDLGPKVEKPAGAAVAAVGQIEIYLHNLIQADAEKDRLGKKLDELQRSIATLEGRLSNASYVDRAPPHLVKQSQDQLVAAKAEAENLRGQIAAL